MFMLYLSLLFVSLLLIYFSYRISTQRAIWISTLLVVIVLSFLINAYTKYYSYKDITYRDMPLTKDLFHYFLREELHGEYIKFTAPKLQKDSNLESFYIWIDQKELNILNADLPSSGFEEYVDARLKIGDGVSKKIKIRYRGGSAWNWRYDNKSLKIKFGDNNSYNMMKTLNFTKLYSLDMLIEPITQKVAGRVGALAPDVKTVRVFLNGKYAGLYLYLDQTDESFLRKIVLCLEVSMMVIMI